MAFWVNEEMIIVRIWRLERNDRICDDGNCVVQVLQHHPQEMIEKPFFSNFMRWVSSRMHRPNPGLIFSFDRNIPLEFWILFKK